MSENRRQRLIQALTEKDLDVYLATNTSDIRWLTGFSGVFDSEQAHLVLFNRHNAVGGACLFTDTRYSGALRTADTDNYWQILDERKPRFAYVVEKLMEAHKGCESESGAATGAADKTGAARESESGAAAGAADATATASEVARENKLRIGIEDDLPLNRFRALMKALEESSAHTQGFIPEVIEVPSLITSLRAIKDSAEVEALKAAQAISDAAYLHMLEYLKPGLTEYEVATELEFFMRRAGAESLAFPSIVASGPNSAIPHAKPSQRVLKNGDFVLMDFGARLGDYCSDMTRTVVLGTASEQQRAMYEATLAAQTRVIETLKPGILGLEGQRIADEVIAQAGFEGRLIHSVGHGVGIDIHELPLLAPKVETALEVGQVVTVEPGVYFEGYGGVRIEDFGIITETGFEDFTNSSHELFEL